jgi:S-adenosylhomocysteine hydrolase
MASVADGLTVGCSVFMAVGAAVVAGGVGVGSGARRQAESSRAQIMVNITILAPIRDSFCTGFIIIVTQEMIISSIIHVWQYQRSVRGCIQRS